MKHCPMHFAISIIQITNLTTYEFPFKSYAIVPPKNVPLKSILPPTKPSLIILDLIKLIYVYPCVAKQASPRESDVIIIKELLW